MKKQLVILLSQLFLIFASLCILTYSDAYYSVYLLLGGISILCAYMNYKTPTKLSWLEYLFSALLATFITLANYSIFASDLGFTGIWQTLASIFSALIIFAGSFSTFINILPIAKTLTIKTNPKLSRPTHPLRTFLFYFAIFLLIDLIIFLLCYYPGNLTSDSIDEVGQLLTDSYSNHHPFYFTLLIKFFVSIGIDWFNNLSFGIALFNIFQIIILSSAFSYSLLTLRQIGISKKLVLALAIFLAILPYNIIFSFTVWKDVLFGAFFLILITTLYRYFQQLTTRRKSLFILLALSGIIICLFRSNAWVAFATTTVIFFFIFKKKYLKLGFLLCGIVVVSFILKTPVLKSLNIPQPDTIESLAIPTQQITRVLVEQKDSLSEDDLSLINQLADPDQLAETYSPFIHDPIKLVIRTNGNVSYLSDHKMEFIALYLKLGITHPAQYLKAWIDQTKGYWNAGYDYWRWNDEIVSNDYGAKQTILVSKIRDSFSTYLQIFEKVGFLQPLISIGLAVWLLIILFYLNIIHKRPSLAFLILFLLTTWGTLLIATPVFSEFRYIYFLFTCLPFLTIVTLTARKKNYEKR